MSWMNCPNCGAPYLEISSRCQYCGTPKEFVGMRSQCNVAYANKDSKPLFVDLNVDACIGKMLEEGLITMNQARLAMRVNDS